MLKASAIISKSIKEAVKMGSFRRNRSEFGKDFESSAVHEEASSVTFRPYTSSEIKQLSACHVFNTNSFNLVVDSCIDR